MHRGCWSRLGAANSIKVQLLWAISIGSRWSDESDDDGDDDGASCLSSDD